MDAWLGTLGLPDRSRRHVRHELTPLLSHHPPDIGAIEGWTAAIVHLDDHLAAAIAA